MDDDSLLAEYDDEYDDKVECEIFHDPFFEIGPYLKGDQNISENPNLNELIFFLKAAWLDPYFYRNRTLCCMTPDCYLPEEKGLLILIQKLLNLNEDEPLDHHLLTVFCMITGRCSELLKFDIVTSANINEVHFKAPFQIYSLPGEGPCCISPYLIILSINETVTFPTVVSQLKTIKIDTRSNKTVEIDDGETTDLRKSFEYANREPPNIFPLSFDSGLTLTTKVTRFPTSDGNFWVRVTCEPFSIAYGSDISNGKGKVKHPWVNRFSGKHPPTLSEDGINTEVDWIDTPNFNSLNDLSQDVHRDLSNFCPFTCPNYESAFKKLMAKLHSEINNYDAIWADPETGRIRNQDMHFLLTAENDRPLIIVECNEFCDCHRNCPYCFTGQPPFPHLMLFYSPDKDWGVVATEDIEPGTLITTYSGEVIINANSDDSVYNFWIEFGDLYASHGFYALHKCNIGRFINQSHESQETESPFTQPNATPRKIMSTFVENCVIGIFSIRKIYKGEEISISYGEHYQMQRKCACNYCMSDLIDYKEMINMIDKRTDNKTGPKKVK